GGLHRRRLRRTGGLGVAAASRARRARRGGCRGACRSRGRLFAAGAPLAGHHERVRGGAQPGPRARRLPDFQQRGLPQGRAPRRGPLRRRLRGSGSGGARPARASPRARRAARVRTGERGHASLLARLVRLPAPAGGVRRRGTAVLRSRRPPSAPRARLRGRLRSRARRDAGARAARARPRHRSLPGRRPLRLSRWRGRAVTAAPSRPATVLYVGLYATIGGAERVLVELCSALDRTAYQPLVVLGEDGPLAAMLRDRGVEVVVEPFPAPPLHQLVRPRILWRELRAALRLRRLARAPAAPLLPCRHPPPPPPLPPPALRPPP